jgi:hypothetical protein
MESHLQDVLRVPRASSAPALRRLRRRRAQRAESGRGVRPWVPAQLWLARHVKLEGGAAVPVSILLARCVRQDASALQLAPQASILACLAHLDVQRPWKGKRSATRVCRVLTAKAARQLAPTAPQAISRMKVWRLLVVIAREAPSAQLSRLHLTKFVSIARAVLTVSMQLPAVSTAQPESTASTQESRSVLAAPVAQ